MQGSNPDRKQQKEGPRSIGGLSALRPTLVRIDEILNKVNSQNEGQPAVSSTTGAFDMPLDAQDCPQPSDIISSWNELVSENMQLQERQRQLLDNKQKRSVTGARTSSGQQTPQTRSSVGKLSVAGVAIP